tara:strand:+ start:344 stop:940 length:597 start_codon:yes stop_codon:yes gene_type:complete
MTSIVPSPRPFLFSDASRHDSSTHRLAFDLFLRVRASQRKKPTVQSMVGCSPPLPPRSIVTERPASDSASRYSVSRLRSLRRSSLSCTPSGFGTGSPSRAAPPARRAAASLAACDRTASYIELVLDGRLAPRDSASTSASASESLESSPSSTSRGIAASSSDSDPAASFSSAAATPSVMSCAAALALRRFRRVSLSQI